MINDSQEDIALLQRIFLIQLNSIAGHEVDSNKFSA